VTSPPLSPADGVANFPQVTVTPSGERVIAWVQDQIDGFTGENVSIRTAEPGADFRPAQTIPGDPSNLQMATAADGTVAIAWIDLNSHSLHVARLVPGQSTFVEATPFVPPTGETPLSVSIAWSGTDLFAAGDAEVLGGSGSGSVWVTKLAAGSNALTVVPGADSGGSLEHRNNALDQPRVFFENVGIAADGNHVVVGWTRVSEDADDQHGQAAIHYALRALNAFTAPFAPDSQTKAGSFPPDMLPAVAAGGGHEYVAWTRDGSPTISYQDLTNPVTKTIDSGGAFSVEDLRAAADASGALTALWTTEPLNQDNESLFSTVVPAGGTPAPTRPVTPIGIERQIGDLAVAPDGSALALAVNEFGQGQATGVEAALRAPGGGFGSVEQVSGTQEDHPNAIFEHPPSAFIGAGQELALWSAADHTGALNLRIHLSERDSTPPTLSGISVPSAAVTGQPVTMSAAAQDSLSTPSVTWSFGDGSQASGATVSHVFGTSGALTVTVTARDSVGNTTSQTRVIAVTKAVRTPVADTTPPVVSGLTASNPRFRVARGTTAVIANLRGTAHAGRKHPKATPQGTTLRLRLSERATLAITLTRRGHRQPSATLVRFSAGPGAAGIAITGRIGATVLAPGTYVATVTAIDGAGNRSRPASVTLTVVRR
jgi:hypothetical protein